MCDIGALVWWIMARKPLDGPEPVPLSELREQWRLSSDGVIEIGPLLMAMGVLLVVVAMVWSGVPAKVWQQVQEWSRSTAQSRVGRHVTNRGKVASHLALTNAAGGGAVKFALPSNGAFFSVWLPVDDREAYDRRLAELNADFGGDIKQLVTHYHPPDHRTQCAAMGLQVRIDEEVASSRKQTSLVWLEPQNESSVACTQEVRVTVGDEGWVGRFVEAVGFRVARQFEVIRRQRSLKGCLVCIDTLPHLGLMAEVCGQKSADVLALAQELCPDTKRWQTQPYTMTLEHYVIQHHIHDGYLAVA